jgi:hypothetical protein
MIAQLAKISSESRLATTSRAHWPIMDATNQSCSQDFRRHGRDLEWPLPPWPWLRVAGHNCDPALLLPAMAIFLELILPAMSVAPWSWSRPTATVHGRNSRSRGIAHGFESTFPCQAWPLFWHRGIPEFELGMTRMCLRHKRLPGRGIVSSKLGVLIGNLWLIGLSERLLGANE